MAKVALLGLGPVGLATAWGLLERGHTVHGYDINPSLVEKCQSGEFPRAAELSGKLRAALNSQFYIYDRLHSLPRTETVVICAGTPADDRGFNLQGVKSALVNCRTPKASGSKMHYILRSTLSPGTIQKEFLPILREGEAFDFSYYPEFLREKFLLDDVLFPPIQAVAHTSASARDRFAIIFPGQFQELKEFASVEALKMACNAFHALKVVFANEISDLCEQSGASAEAVMRAFCEDQKLNLSSKYLKPGAPFGGPCLEKDLKALEYALDHHGIKGDLLRSIRKSNAKRADKIEPEFTLATHQPNVSRDGLFEFAKA